MKQTLLRHVAPVLALCAVLSLGGAREMTAVAAASSGELLAAELPAGLTIASAPTPVLASALKTAIRKNSDQAVPLLRVALLSRPNIRGARTSGKVVRDAKWVRDCNSDVLALTRPAVEVAPDRAQALVNEAIAIAPGCASELQQLLNSPDMDVFYNPGTGFTGPGFTGVPPGFVGSAPGGGVFIPVTPTQNR